MNFSNPIVLVDDDLDDCYLLETAFEQAEILNPIIHFQSSKEALDYLKNTKEKIFLIISDINMPIMNGIEFKKQINSDDILFGKAIPFIFLSTSAASHLVIQAYQLCSQGYFKKPNSLVELVVIARNTANYWNNNILP